VADAGSLVAVLGDADEGGADGVLDLLAGRRAPNNGRVVVDGVDLRELDARTHRASVVELELRPGGERRLCLGDGTMLAARPSPATLAAADLVVVLEDGLEVARGTLRPARAS
jgi:ABC-type multidrug transport system fused ATPase/permease subunit